MKMDKLIIGSHVSFAKEQLLGSVKEALSYGSTTFMFYTGAPQNTFRSTINNELTSKAFDLMKENDIDIDKVIVHAPYIINLANNKEEDKYNFSINFLIEEINRCNMFDIKNLVLHPGSHVGLGREIGLDNIINALNIVIYKTKTVRILLETMAGKGTELGTNFDELKYIIDNIKDKDRIGICLDTCHLNDSGYVIDDFDKILDEEDSKIGLSYVKCIHINDSKNPRESHKDRHENIGYGTIGFDSLIKVIYNDRLKDIPKILETPYIEDKAPYKEEIEMIRKKSFNNTLK
jgi:deoxyribonuclease-4